METAKVWVELLFTYGPFALIVFLVFVCEERARKNMNEATKERALIFNTIYAAVWVAIFALCWVTVQVWIKHASKDNLEITGTLGNFVQELDGDVTLFSTDESLYIRKAYASAGNYSYYWRAVLENQLQEKVNVEFIVQRACPAARRDATATACEPSETEYRLTVDRNFFRSKIKIVQDRKGKSFKYYINDKAHDLMRAESGDSSSGRTLRSISPVSLFPLARAQKSPTPPDIIARRLQSNDPIIRRDAAREFAALGAAGTDWIKRGLFEGEAKNQSRLDALLVLNELPDVERAGFDDKVLERVSKLAFESRGELKQEALKAVAKLRGGRFLAHARVEGQKFARIGGELEGKYAIWVDQVKVKVPTPLHVVMFSTSEKTKELDRFVVVRHSQLKEFVPSGALLDERRIKHQFEYPVSLGKDWNVLVVGKSGAQTVGDRFVDFVFVDMSRRAIAAR